MVRPDTSKWTKKVTIGLNSMGQYDADFPDPYEEKITPSDVNLMRRVLKVKYFRILRHLKLAAKVKAATPPKG